MLNKEIKYTDFNGVEQTQVFSFNISKSELMDMQIMSNGTIQDHFKAIAASNKGSVVLPEFKKILKLAYGVRSDDGKRFVKNDQVWDEFTAHAAYDQLLFDLLTNPGETDKFFKALVPQDMIDQVSKELQERVVDASQTPEQVLTREQSTSDLARERTEAQMQGYRQPQPPKQPTQPSAPSQNVFDTAEGQVVNIAHQSSPAQDMNAQEKAEFDAWRAQQGRRSY